MDSAEIIDCLKDKAGISEVHYCRSFKCFRNLKEGGVQELLVEVLDMGPQHPKTRYSVVATSIDTGRTATGNPDSSVEAAIAMVHWWDLDTPAEFAPVINEKGEPN